MPASAHRTRGTASRSKKPALATSAGFVSLYCFRSIPLCLIARANQTAASRAHSPRSTPRAVHHLEARTFLRANHRLIRIHVLLRHPVRRETLFEALPHARTRHLV